jgi:flagellar motor switch protein FliG
MLNDLVGSKKVLVSVDVTLKKLPISASLQGTDYDRFTSLPGIPVAKSRNVLSAIEDYSISKLNITVFHDINLDKAKIDLVQHSIPLWLPINEKRGDTLELRSIEFNTSMDLYERIRLAVLTAGFVGLAILLLLSLILVLRAITRALRTLGLEGGADVTSEGMASKVGAGIMGGVEGGGTGGGAAGEGAEKEEKSEITKGETQGGIGLGKEDMRTRSKTMIIPLYEKTFNFLKYLSNDQIIKLIKDEEPKHIGVILASFLPERAAILLSALPEEVQDKVIDQMGSEVYISNMELMRIKEILQERLHSMILHPQEVTLGGLNFFKEMVGYFSLTSAKRLIESLENRNPELARSIRDIIFLFEDVINLSDKAVKMVLGMIDLKILAIAIKNTDLEIREKFLRNCSERVLSILEEEISILGESSPETIISSQTEVVRIVRELESLGRIQIAKKAQETAVMTDTETL